MSDIRAAISDAYYDARNNHRTMEQAADAAAAAVEATIARPPVEVDPDPLAAIRRTNDALVVARLKLDVAVLRAREDGHSWATIGNVLGVTRQAAWERFSHVQGARSL